MEIYISIIFGYFCSIFFSFIDAFILRIEEAFFLKSRKKIISKWRHLCGGRSHCDCSQKKTLSWYSLVPIWSFIFQGAKCTFCKDGLSSKYLLGELLAFIFGVFTYWTFGFSLFLCFIVIYALLGYIISFLDYKYLLIPWEYLYCFTFIAILNIIMIPESGVFYFLKTQISFWVCQIALAFFWLFLFGGIYILFPNRLGFSDILLVFVLSLGLPFPKAIYLPSLASIIGLIFVCFSIFVQMPKGGFAIEKVKKQKFPFGMYLVLSFGFLLFWMDK